MMKMKIYQVSPNIGHTSCSLLCCGLIHAIHRYAEVKKSYNFNTIFHKVAIHQTSLAEYMPKMTSFVSSKFFIFLFFAPAWDSDMAALLLLVYLLPPPPGGKKQPGKIAVREALKRVVHFHKVGGSHLDFSNSKCSCSNLK